MPEKLRKFGEYLGLVEPNNGAVYDPGYQPPQNNGSLALAPEPVVEYPEYQAEVTPLRALPPQPEFVPDMDLHRITTIHPRSYNDACLIGEAFRKGVPVIMNLSDMPDGDAKRLVDFSSGLCLGLNGTLERVTVKVFLLSPEHVKVMSADVIASEGSGVAGAIGGQFYNQS